MLHYTYNFAFVFFYINGVMLGHRVLLKVTVEHTPSFVVNLVCCITNGGRVYITKVDWFTPY